MAARKNGIFVEERERPELRAYIVSGVGPSGRRVEIVIERASDPGDAIHQAKKRAALNGWQAVER